ncbi:MAG: helix-turn-helix transcriptional regulator [Clostridia bacterium]|nr:helix-turn-helix transcriptional regulator [Clostridia bacterium]
MIKLYELRKEKGLSQDEVAKILNVTRQSYSRYERGEHELGYKALKAIANFFDVSVDYLLGNSTYFYPDRVDVVSAMGEGSGYSSEERKLIEEYRELNQSGKRLVNETIKTLRATSAQSKEGKIS